VASENEYPDIIKKIMTMAERNPKIILVGLGQENKNITQTYWFDFQKSPFDFWDDFLAALE